MPTSSPATPSRFAPFQKQKKHGRGHAYAYGHNRTGMVGPIPPAPKAHHGHGKGKGKGLVSGLDADGAIAWAKENKWYLLGGALILGAGFALLKQH